MSQANTEHLQLVCPHCAAVNRVQAERLGDGPVCGQCKQPLFSGAPIELTAANFDRHISQSDLPVLVDAGVGTASDAAIAMELGCDGVLMNTAIAHAKDPVLMASAMKKGIEAGREAYLAGRMPRKLYSADPSSPTSGLIGS